MTPKQQQRQKHRESGRYAKVNPRYGCGKSAGENYLSHPLSDCAGSDGKQWDDAALCLCAKCYDATQHMTCVSEFIAYAKAHGGM